MPSKTGADAQVIIRCQNHPPKGNAAPYVAAVAPLGDGLGIICGRNECSERGIIWMTGSAWATYIAGERDFWPRTSNVSLRAGEKIVLKPANT